MAKNLDYFAITPEIERMTALCTRHDAIDPALYAKYDVKRGLRDINGKGVVAGLTEISDIVSSKVVDGKTVSCEGELYYRGISIKDLTGGFIKEKRFGFEETCTFCSSVSSPRRRRGRSSKQSSANTGRCRRISSGTSS